MLRPEDNMPIFRLNINCEGSAFEGESFSAEIVALLRVVAQRIEDGDSFDMYRTIFDSNGNDCGRFALKPWPKLP
jgi:hypothetical protein